MKRYTELKPSAPLQPKTGLRRDTPLARSALSSSPSARSSKPKSAPKRAQMTRRVVDTGPPRDVVEAVYERSAWCCEVCAAHVGPVRGVDHHIHHRRPRQMGGSRLDDTNMPQNLLLLDPSCHEQIESEREAAYAGGWLLKNRWNPLAVPVLIHGHRWVWLGADGVYRDVPKEAS
jgi:5-methylcytosine-specific restriction protein A